MHGFPAGVTGSDRRISKTRVVELIRVMSKAIVSSRCFDTTRTLTDGPDCGT